MQHYLSFVLAALGLVLLSSCLSLTHRRWQHALSRIDQVFAQCEEKHLHDSLSRWTETVRCGNDGVQPLIAESGSPYADLIEAALVSRLAIARQIDAGTISVEDGQARLTALDTQIRTLPGSMLDLLSMTAAENPR